VNYYNQSNFAMNSDQNNIRVPAKRSPTDAQIRQETNVQTVMGFLPKSGTIEADDRISLAREEGYDPMAIELALNPPASTTTDKLRLLQWYPIWAENP